MLRFGSGLGAAAGESIVGNIVGVEIMGLEGGIGGFLHMFDWNKKARKKLFFDGHATSEKKILKSRKTADLLTSPMHLIGQDDEMEEVASTKESSHHSGSLMTEEEGSTFKAPGVIAKLMGLDYIPTFGISESHSTASHASHTFQDGNSLTEIFNRETLPPTSATAISISYCKLFSHVKDSGFLSSNNVSNIIDITEKILESEHCSGSFPGVHSLKAPMNSSKVHDSCAIIAIPKKILMLAESSERIAERGSSGSLGRHTLKRSSKRSKENAVISPFQCTDGAYHLSSDGKDKGKPVDN